MKLINYVTQTGTTVALNSVDLVARVEGFLRAIEFADGAFVKKGQELFIIQPEPYMEQLKAAKASVAIAKSQEAYARSEHARQQRMYQQQATSLNNVEKWLAKSEEAAAEVDKAQANEALAAITYGYTHIASPFDGRIGRHLVSIGNLVGNGVATNLATVEQIDQLYVYFNLNEIDLLTLRKAAREAGFTHKDIQTIKVDVALQTDDKFKYKATLDFINTGLNASTGTMELRALMDNKEHIFVPGLFVQVRIPLTKPIAQLTIPDSAILYDQVGAYVYVVDKDDIVQMKHVTLGTKDQQRRGIISGLLPEDRVIVQGLQNATPGNKVAPKTEKEARPS
jgi:RND family efflux transporter MFP subunit